MAREIAVRGYEKPPATAATSEFELLFGADLHYRVEQRVGTATSARQQASSVVVAAVAAVEASDSDILEVEDAEGVITFHTVGSIRDSSAATRGGPLDIAEIADLSSLGLRGGWPPGAAGRGAANQGRASIVEVRHSSISLPASIAGAVATLNASPVEQAADALGRIVFTKAAKEAMKRIADWIDQPVSDDAPEMSGAGAPRSPASTT